MQPYRLFQFIDSWYFNVNLVSRKTACSIDYEQHMDRNGHDGEFMTAYNR